METQCRHNPNLRAQPRRKTKDVIHRNKVRESYPWDPQTGQYSSEPSEVIKKNRISDEHLKSASVRDPNRMASFASDLRFSCSSEVNQERPSSQATSQAPTIREKERTSFEFQFMTIDMTVTSMTTANNPASQ